jgi:glycosyltransferase involved in cell wall biosynthesis
VAALVTGLPGAPRLSIALLGPGSDEAVLTTLRDLQRQSEASCEFLVLRRSGDSGCLEAVARADGRIRLLDGSATGEEADLLDRAIAEARSPLFCVVRPGERVMHRAAALLCDALARSPDAGLAHTWWIPVPPEGQLPEHRFQVQRKRLAAFLPEGLRHRHAMLVFGNVVQSLPTFRTDLLRTARPIGHGSLEQALHVAILRVLKEAGGTVVAQILCARPASPSRRWDLTGPTGYLAHLLIHRRVRGRLPGKLGYPLPYFAMLVGKGMGWHLARSLAPMRSEQLYLFSTRFRRIRTRIARLVRSSLDYRRLIAALDRWPLRLLLPGPANRPIDGTRIGYFRAVYPGHTETFLRRELESLRNAGLPLEMLAIIPPQVPQPPDSNSPAGEVHYLDEADERAGQALLRKRRWTRPVTTLRLVLFAIHHPYRVDKTWSRDLQLFREGVRLAGAMQLRGITHLHSSFADRGAAICFIAARLLRISYSVQARASELHRFADTEAALDRIRPADFVVTNSKYNERFLTTHLQKGRRRIPPVRVIYNGLDLARFQPDGSGAAPESGKSFRILSVGRLIEPKGFRYLLPAIRILRERGIEATGEIIGGPVDPGQAVTWVELRMLLQELELEPWVRFRGFQPFSEVLAAFRRADVLALPCVAARSGSHDITPNVLIEAMAMGLPVVSTRSGAIPEMVEHEVTGLLVPTRDAGALADALERLAGDSALRASVGRAGREAVERQFDGRRNVLERLELFGRPLAQESGTR